MGRVVVWDDNGVGRGYDKGSVEGLMLIGSVLFIAIGAAAKSGYDLTKLNLKESKTKKKMVEKELKRKAFESRFDAICEAFLLTEEEKKSLREKSKKAFEGQYAI